MVSAETGIHSDSSTVKSGVATTSSDDLCNRTDGSIPDDVGFNDHKPDFSIVADIIPDVRQGEAVSMFSKPSVSDQTGVCLFKTKAPTSGRIISIFPSCVQGTCNCVHYLDGIACQLRPCRFASMMCKADGSLINPADWPLLENLIDGFPITDDIVTLYECENYGSILDPTAKSKMDSIIEKELSEGMISIAQVKPV